MKKIIILTFLSLVSAFAFAGNKDRIGQAGAMQLNINGWGRSSGWGWSGVSNSRGLESMFTNVGGLAFTEKTELIFSRTAWLMGSDININNFGFAQELGGAGVLGVSIMTYDVGEIPITTYEQPDGGIGTYKPNLSNIAVGYSKRFTRSISGGVNFKFFSESTTNAKAQGFGIDAGVMYVTTLNEDQDLKKNDVKFGVSLKNVGKDARYSGDGLTTKMVDLLTDDARTVALRTASFNLPALVCISGSYDFRLDQNNETYFHRLTPALSFTNNAFSSNQFTLGMEYAYKEMFQLRTGYAYEDGILSYDTRATVFTGFMGGFTFEVPVSAGSSTTFALDYSFRHSNPFGGSHTFGVRLNMGAE